MEQANATTTYFDRNRLWLIPLIAACFFTVAPELVDLVEPNGFVIPRPVMVTIALASMVLCGIGAKLTDTLSARYIQWTGCVVVAAAVVTWVLR